MPVVKELIRSEQDGSLSFGNYQLDTKSKVSDFEHCGDSYKVDLQCKLTNCLGGIDSRSTAYCNNCFRLIA